MKCRRCGSTDIRVESIPVTKTKSKGWKYWLLGGWAFSILKYMLFGVLALFPKIFKKPKVSTKIKKMATCQSCGYSRRLMW